MITAAAIKRDSKIYTGRRHCNIIHDMVHNHGCKTPIRGDEQGFVDDDAGSFMSRGYALDHAYECGQIKLDDKGNFDIIGGVLTSEDLW